MLEVILIAVGSLFVIAPQWKARGSRQRLENLRAGAPERFFEERRSLEAYPPQGSWRSRLLGSAIIILAVTALVLNHAR